jgi:hypothetical protein
MLDFMAADLLSAAHYIFRIGSQSTAAGKLIEVCSGMNELSRAGRRVERHSVMTSQKPRSIIYFARNSVSKG